MKTKQIEALLIVASIFVVISIAVIVPVIVTFLRVSNSWQEKYDTDMQEQADILNDLQNEYNILSSEHENTIVEFNELSTEYRIEIGKAEQKRIRDIWIMYYNTCLYMTNGRTDTCLKSARGGYVDGVHDSMRPSQGWDGQYVEFGETQEEG